MKREGRESRGRRREKESKTERQRERDICKGSLPGTGVYGRGGRERRVPYQHTALPPSSPVPCVGIYSPV